MSITIPTHAKYTDVVLVGCLFATQNIPATDVELIGTKISKNQAAGSIGKHSVFQNVSMNEIRRAQVDTDRRSAGSVTKLVNNSFVIETDLNSRTWKMTDHMGNLNAKTKIEMLNKPIHDMSTASTKLKKYLVTLRVLVLATNATTSIPFSILIQEVRRNHFFGLHQKMFSLFLLTTVFTTACAGTDILLKPQYTTGKPIGVVAIEGAEIPNEAYVPLMLAFQKACEPEFSVYISIPSFILDCPNPPQIAGKIADARKALFAAMGTSTDTKVIGFAHSLGAVFLQDYVELGK